MGSPSRSARPWSPATCFLPIGATREAGCTWYTVRPATRAGNRIWANRAASSGGGLTLGDSRATLVNNVVADNQAGDRASEVHVVGLTSRLVHTTLAGTLWYGNAVNWDGAGTVVTGTVNAWDDPVFAHAAGGNCHLREGSAAMDAGLNAGVVVDVDGKARPSGLGLDLGADEFWPPWRVYLPGVWRGD